MEQCRDSLVLKISGKEGRLKSGVDWAYLNDTTFITNAGQIGNEPLQ